MKYSIFSGDALSSADIKQMRSSYEDLILLRFRVPGAVAHDTIAVSKSSLKKWVKKEVRSGQDINKLKLASAYCDDGRERDFVLNMSVWRESILSESKTLASLYSETSTNTVAFYRGLQLKEVQQDLPDLLQRIKFWVADLLEMKTNGRNKRLRERIEMPPIGDDPAYFSPFYFQPGEARYVQSQTFPCGTTCGQEWSAVFEKVLDAKMVPCTSHHLAPVIIRAFNLEMNFHCNPQFKTEKIQWINSRRGLLGSNN